VSGQLYARPLYAQKKSPWYPLKRRIKWWHIIHIYILRI